MMNATKSRSTMVMAGAFASFFVGAHAMAAQNEFPNRTIKIVVPTPPGSLLDLLPRIIAEKLSTKLGQPVIIENRPGASNNIGAEAVANAEPNGYTLFVSPPGPLAVSKDVYLKLGYDPDAFTAVTTLIKFPLVLVVNPKMPVSSVSELIAYARENPGKLTYASPGRASTPQLATEKFLGAAGITMVHVPYQGLGPAMRDLLAGHIDIMLDAPGAALPHIKEGKIKAIAVTGEKRLRELPDVPTLSETIPEFVHTEWFALVAPPKTPPSVVTKLSQAIAETLRLPDVAERLQNFSVTPVGSSPEETSAFLKKERERWHEIIVNAGIKPQ